MLTIRDTKTTPREKWRYPMVDGTEMVQNSYMNLMREIQLHYQGMNQQPPSKEVVHQYLCENLSIPCHEGGVPYRNRYTDPPTFAKRGLPSPDWGSLSMMKAMAQDGDRGLGDIVERAVGPIGGSLFKAWFLRTFGKSCGCKERQEEWNALYPL